MILCTNCTDCKLHSTRRHIVWGEGPEYAKLMLIGEGPGEMEDIHGTPFYSLAPSGMELNRLLHTIGLSRDNVYISNIVKCRPPKNRDPEPDERAACRKWLVREINMIRPQVLVTVGAIATKSILGDVDMEMVHGIPFEASLPENPDFKFVIVPCYHPAAGLRNSDYALKCVLDFRAVGAVLRGTLTPAYFKDPLAGAETYSVLETPYDLHEAVGGYQHIALDTETLDYNYTPYMVSISGAPGTGHVIFADNQPTLKALDALLRVEGITTLIHNSLFDLFVLDRLDIHPALVHDTMIMAYLLQSEPQGLKPLAFRYWGMVMKDYSDMVALASAGMAEGYLQQVMQYDWPMPEKVMEIKPGGVVHYRQPQNISKLVSRMLNDAKSLKISREDLYGRWNKLDPDETSRSFVEACLGEMPIGNLSMVSREEAIWYSARDADATIRVHPYLWRQILDTDMTRVFDLDMGIVPVVKDMMETGITPLPDALNALGTRFGRSMAELEAQIKALTGVKAINLGSPLQVADLLFKKLRLKSLAKHGKLSTDDKTLGKLVGAHPAVPLIRQWRSYQKLKGTYADKLMQYAGEDGRIHAQLKITRTATGRLASAKPNIMNQPTRTDDGKAIRKCFSAGPGRVFVSNDLSQIEMRVLADQSGDPRLIQIFKEGLDIHSMTASGIFNVPIDQLDEMLHRYPSKRVGFGVVYGITAEGLREQLLMIGLDPNYWTLNRCSKLIDDWFGLYKDVDLYMADLEAFARRHGYVVDMFGRRRYLATVKSSNKWARAEALRQAGNMPIQSGAAGIFKAGMRATLDVYREINAQGGYARPVVPIHDDLVFEVDEDLVEIWVPLIQNAMENAVKLKVPILSEAKVGKIWGEQVKYTTEWGKA